MSTASWPDEDDGNAISSGEAARSKKRSSPPKSKPPQSWRTRCASVVALVAMFMTMNAQTAAHAKKLEAGLEQHPAAKAFPSQPGFGTILGARALDEFGDDPDRHAIAESHKDYGGTSPITRASGVRRVVLARYARTRRLADATCLWAFAGPTAFPAAHALYDAQRAAGDTRHAALRALGNRLVGILHGCLASGSRYDEHTAWGHRSAAKAA